MNKMADPNGAILQRDGEIYSVVAHIPAGS